LGVTLNPNWTRWIFASVADHMHTACSNASVPLVIEQLNDPDDDWMKAAHKAKLHIVGPQTKQTSPSGFDVTFGIFAVVTSHRQTTDRYEHHDKVGLIAEALDQCILIKDYGNPSPVEITRAKPIFSGVNAVTHLGQSEIENLVHSTIEVEFNAIFKQ
jgi:hypothetical protein